MFTDQDLKDAIKQYFQAGGLTVTDSAANSAVSSVRAKVKNNTLEELKLALSELKQEIQSDDKKEVTDASMSLVSLLNRTNAIISFAISMRQPVKIDEEILKRINNDLQQINSSIRVAKETTAKGIQVEIKEFRKKLNLIYKELDKIDNYDPIVDNNSTLELAMQNPEIMEASEADIPLIAYKRNTKNNPTAKMDNYISNMPKQQKLLLDKVFGPVQWVNGAKGKDPIFPRKRINFELLKGKTPGQIPGATGINGSYHRKMASLKASKQVYEQIIAEMDAVLNNLWNRGKNLAIEQHIDSELRTGFYHIEPQFIKAKVEQLGNEMKQVLGEISKSILSGKKDSSAEHQQELYDNLIEAGIEQDAQLSERWLDSVGGKSDFNFLQEASMFSSVVEPAFFHSQTDKLASTPVRQETTLGTSNWEIPDMSPDDPSKYQIAKMPASFSKGRIIYNYLTKDDSNEKVVDDYKFIINNSESRVSQDSRNPYVSFGGVPVSKLQLAKMPGLHWKIYWALSRAEVARDEELAGEAAPFKQYDTAVSDYTRLSLAKNESVPDFVLMYMVQYDKNNVVRSKARTELGRRGLEIAKDSKGEPIKQEVSGIQEYAWKPTTPKKKVKPASLDPWLTYFAQVPTSDATPISGSDRLNQVQQQQALDLAAKEEAQTAQKKAEEDKKLLQEQARKKIQQQPVSQPTPPQAPDNTNAQPGSKMPPQGSPSYAFLSRRDMRK